MVLVMNELHCHNKNRHLLDKNSQRNIICYNYKINNLQIALYTSAYSQMFNRIVGVLKDFANLTGKHLRQVKCERKSLTLSMQPAPSL